jgi:hypothetical protein
MTQQIDNHWRQAMKQGNRILIAALFAAASTVALAQAGGGNGGGGNGNGGGGGGNGHGAATAGPTTNGNPASGTMANSHMSHHKPKMQKSATDTTNMPGADASSDAKGR